MTGSDSYPRSEPTIKVEGLEEFLQTYKVTYTRKQRREIARRLKARKKCK